MTTEPKKRAARKPAKIKYIEESLTVAEHEFCTAMAEQAPELWAQFQPNMRQGHFHSSFAATTLFMCRLCEREPDRAGAILPYFEALALEYPTADYQALVFRLNNALANTAE